VRLHLNRLDRPVLFAFTNAAPCELLQGGQRKTKLCADLHGGEHGVLRDGVEALLGRVMTWDGWNPVQHEHSGSREWNLAADRRTNNRGTAGKSRDGFCPSGGSAFPRNLRPYPDHFFHRSFA
jgi:hypothetical protein